MFEIRKINWLEADEAQRARIVERYRSQVEGFVAELEALFPTRDIVSGEFNGSITKRLSACSSDLGYKNWKTFAADCGFKVDGAGAGVIEIDVSERIDCILWSAGKKADDMLAKIADWYPDGDVSTLRKNHEKSTENLSKIAQNLGYESWRELLADCGYDVSKLADARGGRPVTNDYEALVEELLERYEGKPRPTTAKQISEENPDLAGTLKSLSNECIKLYGVKPKEFLQIRGLLAGKPKKKWDRPASLEEWLDSLDDRDSSILTARFGGCTLDEAGEQHGLTKEGVRQIQDRLIKGRPSIIQDEHMELADLSFEEFEARTGETKLVYGYLQMASGAAKVKQSRAKKEPVQELEDVEAFLEELKARYDGRVRESSLSAFEAANPDFKANSKYVKRYLSSLGTTPKAYLEEAGFISKIAAPDSVPRPKREVVEAFVKNLGHADPDEFKSRLSADSAYYSLGTCVFGSVSRDSARKYEMLRTGDPVELSVDDELRVAIGFCGETIDRIELTNGNERRVMNRILYPEEYGLVEGSVRAVVADVSGGAKRPKAEIHVYFAEDETALNVVDGMYLSRDGEKLLEYAGPEGCSVSVPEGVKEIAPRAFEEALIKEVSLPDTLETIGPRAFFCSGLRSVEVPSSVTSIGEAAFATYYQSYDPSCKITKVSVAKGNGRYISKGGSMIEAIGDERRLVHAYHSVRYCPVNGEGASLVTIPKGVTTIARGSLSEGLEAILTLPEGLAKIEVGAFKDVSVDTFDRELRIPATLVDVGDDFWSSLFYYDGDEPTLPPGAERAIYCPVVTIDGANPRLYMEGDVVYVRERGFEGSFEGIEPAEPGESYEFAYESPSGVTVAYSFDF